MEPITERTLTKNSIVSVRYYQCGHCSNRLGFAYRGESFNKSQFPSGVFLIKHETMGYLLFDTGYSDSIKKSGCAGWLYRYLNPVNIDEKSSIKSQLQADGIEPEQIQHVILSHLHPDHIGGIKYFPNAKFLISRNMLDSFYKHKPSDLILNKLFPSWFESQVILIDDGKFKIKELTGFNGYDIFNDESIMLIKLDGHAHGHLGALIPEKIVLAGDSCWSNDLVSKSNAMRIVMNFVNHNQSEFKNTLEKLKILRNNGVKLCFSHEKYQEKELFNVK